MTQINGNPPGAVLNIPALMICYNRVLYSQQAFKALYASDCTTIMLVDNGSTDGTYSWLKSLPPDPRVMVSYINRKSLKSQRSIARAMNFFLNIFKDVSYFIKVDNDTIIPPDFCARMLPHMKHAGVVQAKHKIIEATHPGGWGGFTANMKRENGLLYNHFVGGTGIMVKRQRIVGKIPETDWPLGGWRQWQAQHPDVKKAFAEDVEIKLLDEHGYTDYPDYYKETGRL